MPELPVESWSVTQAITSRTSQRTYNGRALTPNTRAALEAALRQPPPAPFGNSIRLAVLDTTTAESRVPLGTYGIIRGARSFVAGVVHRGEHAEEDFGFVLEWAILRATSLGLGTCWLGGTLRRHEFGAAMAIKPGEFIPAVTPVGYARGRRNLLDAATRWGAGSAKRKSWSVLFFKDAFETTLSENDAGRYSRVLEMVRWAPSASNRQPWRIILDRSRRAFHFFLQRTAGYPSPGVDLQRIDMGIAMCHFELSARELGMDGHWEVLPVEIGALPERTSYVATWISTAAESSTP